MVCHVKSLTRCAPESGVVPAPPRTLLARLQFLEDHIIQLEKEYPPWAALHFNQPHRGVCFIKNNPLA